MALAEHDEKSQPSTEQGAIDAIDASHDPEISARYGRTSGSRRRNRTVIGVVAAAFAVVLTAWVVWAGLDAVGPGIDARDQGFTVVSDRTVTVTYALSVEPGTPTRCIAQAMNEQFAVIGWRVFDVPASERRTRTLETDVKTTETANTGLIYRCWLA